MGTNDDDDDDDERISAKLVKVPLWIFKLNDESNGKRNKSAIIKAFSMH